MPAQTIDEVIAELAVIIQDSKRDENPLGYFAALYHNVTVTIKENLNTNYFENDVRMEELDVIFANRYLSAYSDFKSNGVVTDSWLYAFKAAEDNNLIVLQQLLLGMNAHINLDLGIAAAQISNEGNIHELESDFNKINDILGSLLDQVQSDLGEIWPTLLKIVRYLKETDDFLINFSMKIARDEAWRFALSIVGKGDTELSALIKSKDVFVLGISKRVTTHKFLIKLVFLIIRISELGKVSDKILALERLVK